jgi:hypothetical protein
MGRIVRRWRTISRTLDQRTPPKAPDRRSWSSNDTRATYARGRHRRRQPRLTRPLEWPAHPVATTAVAEAYRAIVVATGPRVHRLRSSASGALSSLDPGAPPPLACPRELLPPNLIPGGLGVFYSHPGATEPNGTVGPGLSLVIWSPDLIIYKLYI